MRILRPTAILILLALTASAAPLAAGAADDAIAGVGRRGGARLDALGRAAMAPSPLPRGGDGPVGQIPQQIRDPWQPLGPFGGDVEAVAVSPANPLIALAGIAPSGSSGGTLYRSADGGASWTEVTAFSGLSVYALAFAPDGTAYAGTDDGLRKSVNGGLNWTQLPLGIGLNDTVYEVDLNPTNAQHLWIGVGDAMGSQDRNVLRSQDGGLTWSDVTPPMTPMSCRGIAFRAGNPNTVYACFGGSFGGGAFWVSTNYGANWTNRSAGLPANPLEDVEHDGARVLVTGGQLFGGQNVGLYASANDGANWTPLHGGDWPVLAHKDLDLDPNDPDVILLGSLGAGIYRSADGGATWTFGTGGTAGVSVNAVRFAPGSSMRILVGASSRGVLISEDGGAHFAASSVGIGALEVHSIDANPNDPDEMAVSYQSLNSGGVYSTLDGGLTWTAEACPGTRWNDVRFAPDGTLYALSDGPSSIAPEGVYRREADGAWTCLGPDQGGLFETKLFAIRFSRNDPSLILIGGADFGVAGFEATVWISDNAGASWTKAYEGVAQNENVKAIEIAEDGADSLAVAGFDDFDSDEGNTGGALRSTDGGWTWKESSTGLPYETHGTALSITPEDPYTFYLADGYYAGGGLYRSTDGGLNWVPTGFGGVILDVIVDALSPNVVYILQSAAPKVSRSEDYGATFAAYDEGLALAGGSMDLAYVLAPDPRLLLATSTGSWLRDMSLTAAPGEAPAAAVLLGAAPNPFNPSTAVAFRLEAPGRVTLAVFTIDGRRVRTLLDGAALPAGEHRAVWDGRDEAGRPLGSGLYLCRLSGEAGGGVLKLSLIK